MNAETRNCQNCKKDFTIDSEDFDFYKKIDVPPPTFCWKCRAMRRMAFRNFRYLYQRECAATGKKIYSIIPPEAPMPVYDRDYWISDAWNPMDYGCEYDFTKPFFEQFKELFYAVPATTILNQNAVNSEYGQGISVKNCYMCFDAGYAEDSAYGVTLQKSKQCFDTINCKLCELCYYVINTTSCYKTFFSRNCTSCEDVWFSQDCVGCSDCFGCAGLRNKKYHIFNKPYSKEEYKRKLEEFQIHSSTGIEKSRALAESVWLSHPVRFRHGIKDTGCTGDYIFNSSQLRNCFFANEAQNCANSQSIIYNPIRDCADITSSGIDVELDYEVVGSGLGINRTCFALDCITALESQYIIYCRNVRNCFGCVALNDKQYCIFNKQYSKEEYESMVPKIIEQMNNMPYKDSKGRLFKYGEFFPPEISPFGFNESQGYEYFQISKEETEEMGFKWRIPEKRSYAVTKEPEKIPDTISEVGDGITKDIIRCEHDKTGKHPFKCAPNCSTAFRITHQELRFYRQMNLPLPKLCFNCRHSERISWRNPPQLYKRKCMCAVRQSANGVYKNQAKHLHHNGQCPNEFETSYAPNRPEIVYCEQCYNNEVA